jgi:hypothetical protein
MAENFLVTLWYRLFPPTLKKVGILTLAQTENTPSFRAFHHAMQTRHRYVRGRDYDTAFSPAVDDADLPRAAGLLLHVDVVLAGGNQAVIEMHNKSPTMKIVQSIGGDKLPNSPNVTGHYLDVLANCRAAVTLLIKNYHPATITVLVNDSHSDILKQLKLDPEGGRIKELVVSTPTDLTQAKFNSVKDSFMVIPNGMFFENAKKIANLVENKDIPKVYPETDYWDHHNNKRKAWVRGHKIPETFDSAADQVVTFLKGKPKDALSRADAANKDPQ